MTEEKDGGQDSGMVRLLKELIPAIGVLLVLVLGAYVLWFSSVKVSDDPGDWAALGDYFGGLMNPIISFATLMVAYAVWRNQKDELRQTKDALREQATTAEQQRREQRFFDLLNLYQQALSTLEVAGLKGRGAFVYQLRAEDAGSPLYLFAAHGFDTYTRWFKVRDNTDNRGRLVSTSEETSVTLEQMVGHWEQHSSGFDHYFRTVFSILREAEPTLKSDHYRYVKLFRAQLSRDELVMLGFNS